MYFTDRGIEELTQRRGSEQLSVQWLADRLQTLVDLNPQFETAIDRPATWLTRLDDDADYADYVDYRNLGSPYTPMLPRGRATGPLRRRPAWASASRRSSRCG